MRMRSVWVVTAAVLVLALAAWGVLSGAAAAEQPGADPGASAPSGLAGFDQAPPADRGEVSPVGDDVKFVVEDLRRAGVHLEYRQAQPMPHGEGRAGDVGVLGSIPISGILDPGSAHLYGPFWYNAGDVVTISIAWTPAASTFRIGLTSQASGIFYYCTVYNGSGTCRLRVNTAGYYYPTIWNVGPDRATYNGYVSW